MDDSLFKISLEVIKLLTPFIIAAGVYILWHKQKEKEVVASEAKNALTTLNSMLRKKADFFTVLYDIEEFYKTEMMDSDELKNKLKSAHTEFLDLAGELEHSLNFICDAKDNNNVLRSEFLEKLAIITNRVNDLTLSYRLENLNSSEIQSMLNKEKQKFSFEINESIYYLKYELLSFALYRN